MNGSNFGEKGNITGKKGQRKGITKIWKKDKSKKNYFDDSIYIGDQSNPGYSLQSTPRNPGGSNDNGGDRVDHNSRRRIRDWGNLRKTDIVNIFRVSFSYSRYTAYYNYTISPISSKNLNFTLKPRWLLIWCQRHYKV